jgi:hypothetical protein
LKCEPLEMPISLADGYIKFDLRLDYPISTIILVTFNQQELDVTVTSNQQELNVTVLVDRAPCVLNYVSEDKKSYSVHCNIIGSLIEIYTEVIYLTTTGTTATESDAIARKKRNTLAEFEMSLMTIYSNDWGNY